MIVTLPIGIGLIDWADQITLDLDDFVMPFKLMDENNWQEWAAQFCAYGTLPGSQPPNPYMFNDWQEWAQRFCEALGA
jgi:hypothetical protein